MVTPEVLVVGGGRLARTVLRTMPERISCCIVRSGEGAEHLARIAPNISIRVNPETVDDVSFNIVWVLVADSAIRDVSAYLASIGTTWDGCLAIHSSGIGSRDELLTLADSGCVTAVLHPNGAFTGFDRLPEGLVWTISTGLSAESQALIGALLAGLAPTIVPIGDESRSLYHAAASLASNYSIVLFELAHELFCKAGLPRELAAEVVRRYIVESAERGAAFGANRSLTGPVARGDTGVLVRQLTAIREQSAGAFRLYRELMIFAARMVGREGEVLRAIEDTTAACDDH